MRRLTVLLALLSLTLVGFKQDLTKRADSARSRLRDDRGSVSLEQVIWTVALFGLAIAITVIVVRVATNRANTLN